MRAFHSTERAITESAKLCISATPMVTASSCTGIGRESCGRALALALAHLPCTRGHSTSADCWPREDPELLRRRYPHQKLRRKTFNSSRRGQTPLKKHAARYVFGKPTNGQFC